MVHTCGIRVEADNLIVVVNCLGRDGVRTEARRQIERHIVSFRCEEVLLCHRETCVGAQNLIAVIDRDEECALRYRGGCCDQVEVTVRFLDVPKPVCKRCGDKFADNFLSIVDAERGGGPPREVNIREMTFSTDKGMRGCAPGRCGIDANHGAMVIDAKCFRVKTARKVDRFYEAIAVVHEPMRDAGRVNQGTGDLASVVDRKCEALGTDADQAMWIKQAHAAVTKHDGVKIAILIGLRADAVCLIVERKQEGARCAREVQAADPEVGCGRCGRRADKESGENAKFHGFYSPMGGGYREGMGLYAAFWQSDGHRDECPRGGTNTRGNVIKFGRVFTVHA
jgi:hypothetical protein